MNQNERVLSLCFLGFLIFVLAVAVSHARGKEKTFPLGQPLNELSTLCVDKEAAINVVNSTAKNPKEGAVLLQLYFNFGACANVTTVVVYTALVHQVILKDGITLNVYEGRAGKVPVFHITDWNHIEQRI